MTVLIKHLYSFHKTTCGQFCCFAVWLIESVKRCCGVPCSAKMHFNCEFYKSFLLGCFTAFQSLVPLDELRISSVFSVRGNSDAISGEWLNFETEALTENILDNINTSLPRVITKGLFICQSFQINCKIECLCITFYSSCCGPTAVSLL